MTSSTRVLEVAKPTPVALTEPQGWWPRLILAVFVVIPFLALLAAIPVAWEWGLSWSDAVIAATMYLVTEPASLWDSTVTLPMPRSRLAGGFG